MITLIHYIWCFPQTLAALILRLFVKVYTKEKRNNAIIYKCNLKNGSISLGHKIFLCKSHWEDEETKRHEYGHYKQSLILGWLYLIVIGLPSIIWCNCFEKYRVKHNISYYWFYPEKWANKLGGVENK